MLAAAAVAAGPVARYTAAAAAQLGAAGATVVADLAAAVQAAARAARPGQVVLLAPGCASFDEFRDYAQRGDRFRALVEDL